MSGTRPARPFPTAEHTRIFDQQSADPIDNLYWPRPEVAIDLAAVGIPLDHTHQLRRIVRRGKEPPLLILPPAAAQ